MCAGVNFKPNIPKIVNLNLNFINEKNKTQLAVIHSKDFSKFIEINENFLTTKKKPTIVGNGASSCDILKKITTLKNYNNSEIFSFC